MSTDLEDRIRRHYAERTLNEPLLDEKAPSVRSRRRRSRPVIGVAAAAAVVAIALVVVADRDDKTPVVTNEPTTTVAPTSSTSTSGAPTTTVIASSTTTLAPAVATTQTVVVVSESAILGWWDGAAWVPWRADLALPIAGGERYRLVYLDHPLVTATGAAPAEGCFDDLPPHIDIDGFTQGIAVTGTHDVRPRRVEQLPVTGAYRDAAADVLADLGVDDPDPELAQVVVADLEGDGTDEVFVTAERIADSVGMVAQEGEYSVVFVRRLVGSEVVQTVLESWVAHPVEGEIHSTEANRVEALADLNGDGRMEIVTSERAWEFGGTRVYDSADRLLFENWCGV